MTAEGTVEQVWTYDGHERRSRPRVYGPHFLAHVRARDRGGRRFELDTVVDDVSASGLFMQLSHGIEAGTRLLILLTPAAGSPLANGKLCIAVRGISVRTETRADRLWGVGVRFSCYRFVGGAA